MVKGRGDRVNLMLDDGGYLGPANPCQPHNTRQTGQGNEDCDAATRALDRVRRPTH